jgi:hypothetical protein
MRHAQSLLAIVPIPVHRLGVTINRTDPLRSGQRPHLGR